MTKLFILFFTFCACQTLTAYSVVTHIAVIDSSWESIVAPSIKKKFPQASAEEINEVRKFAYGGCIIQDLGYYPGGNKLFSDLLHYVRSGDFLAALIRNSQTPGDYAFALGALSHYASDNSGHAVATNLAVPILYPELRAKFGDVVTFDEKPSAHMKVEFGYDVIQVARGRYLSDDYHDFIGFDVSQELLRKTFREIYGMSLTELLRDYDAVIGAYRSTITGLIPDAIKVAWELKKDELEKLSLTREKFFFRMPKAQFEKTYGIRYKRPSIFSKILAFFVRILPPIGPLKVLRFKPPTPEVEAMFLKSYETTLADYNRIVQNVSRNLPNKDLDTGKETRLGEYKRADETYGKWLERLSRKKFATLDEPIKRNIFNFYSIASGSPHVDEDDWKDIQQQLQKLKAMTATEK